MCSRKHRILQVFSSLDLGGAESRMMDVYRRIDREKFHFDFLSMRPEKQYFETEIEQLGGRVIKIRPPRKSGILGNLRDMVGVMKDGRYDVVHAHTSFHCALATLAARMAGVPIRIAHGRTSGSMNTSKMNGMFLFLGRCLMPFGANRRLAISRDAGEYLFGRSSFTVLPNAIDCVKYQRVDKISIDGLRDEFSIGPGEIVIGMVGRFNKMKNHKFAVEWFSHYLEKNPESVLVLVGGGAYERLDVPNLCDELGIASSVRFTGVRSDVNVWMNLFDVLIVPSTFEGLGGVILEAQAAGLPVVKSDSFTNEADMGIGLVKEVSLNADYGEWDKAIDYSVNLRRPSKQSIREAFGRRHYSLETEIKDLCRLYGGEDVDMA